jgi:hypothetical protein
MGLGVNKRSFGVTAAIISHNHFDSIRRTVGSGSMAAYDKVAELTNEFENEHRETNWEDSPTDYESTLYDWVNNRLSVIRSEILAAHPLTEGECHLPYEGRIAENPHDDGVSMAERIQEYQSEYAQRIIFSEPNTRMVDPGIYNSGVDPNTDE